MDAQSVSLFPCKNYQANVKILATIVTFYENRIQHIENEKYIYQTISPGSYLPQLSFLYYTILTIFLFVFDKICIKFCHSLCFVLLDIYTFYKSTVYKKIKKILLYSVSKITNTNFVLKNQKKFFKL